MKRITYPSVIKYVLFAETDGSSGLKPWSLEIQNICTEKGTVSLKWVSIMFPFVLFSFEWKFWALAQSRKLEWFFCFHVSASVFLDCLKILFFFLRSVFLFYFFWSFYFMHYFFLKIIYWLVLRLLKNAAQKYNLRKIQMTSKINAFSV